MTKKNDEILAVNTNAGKENASTELARFSNEFQTKRALIVCTGGVLYGYFFEMNHMHLFER